MYYLIGDNVFKGYKFRLYTNTNQERELDTLLESHRCLYNHMLNMRIASWECDRFRVNYCFQSRCFTALRKESYYFRQLNFSSAQATMRRLDKAYQDFFRRMKTGAEKVGFPRFKGKNRLDIIEFPTYGDGISIVGEKLRVKHVGLIRIKQHRKIEGKVKTITVKKRGRKMVFNTVLRNR